MENENDNGADEAQGAPVVRAGAQLRAAREALRLDLANVAAETRIPMRHLETIEEGDFESLPSRAYAIGFARTYAKAVGLDPAQITDVVRGELSDGSMRRVMPASAMEPGDPARLPSAGLAWAGAFAALLLAVGAYAFYNAYFGAGTQPGSLLTPAAEQPLVAKPSPLASAPVTGGDVVLTALEDNIWMRLYEEGGERLIERTLKKSETVLVPGEAKDPRLNTGRPDALAITIGGRAVPKLAETPTTLSSARVSAAALLARDSAVAPSTDAAVAVDRAPASSRPQRRVTNPVPANAAAAPDDASGASVGAEAAVAPASSAEDVIGEN